MKGLALIVLICSVMVLSACGGGDSTAATQETTQAPAATAEEAASRKPKGGDASNPIAGAPRPAKVTVPSGPPPKNVVIKDLKLGWGPAARPNMRLVVHFVGIDYKSHKPFEVRWSRKRPFLFEYDHGLVMVGWEKGLAGMRVGGRRKLIVPSRLAYKQGAVVYVIDLLAAEDRSQYR